MALIQLPDQPRFELTMRDADGAKTTFTYFIGLSKETAEELVATIESDADDKYMAAKTAIAATTPSRSYIELAKRLKRAGAWDGEHILTIGKEICDNVINFQGE